MLASLLPLSLALCAGALLPLAARAVEVERYAVAIGNDLGAPGEAPLRYARADAAKVAGVLQEVGGFAPENVILLQAADAAAVLRALIALNDRIRSQSSRSGVETLLFVYYSGHADRRALHLGEERFDLVQLEQLVRGSAATVRLLVVDACNSGALTRVKGGSGAPAMSIDVQRGLSGEGIVFLTSSSASEQAQESDELRGSFFTHYLASGLLGAADSNHDGMVALKEAYRHAYDNTVRASSRTELGTQHPTFRYELGGQGDIVLSQLRLGSQRATLRVPPGLDFLLLQHDSDGPVVAEVSAQDRARTLTLRPGRYFARGRGSDYLLEGPIELAPGADQALEVRSLRRVDYARLVRKGASAVERVHDLALGYQLRTAIVAGEQVCHGPAAAYTSELPSLRLGARLGLCRGQLANVQLSADTDELQLSARAAYAWDTPRVTFDLGAAAGGSVLRQSFASDQVKAPTRYAGAGSLELGGSLTRYLPAGLYVAAELGALAYSLRIESSQQARDLVVRFAGRFAFTVGWQILGRRARGRELAALEVARIRRER